MKRCSAGAVGAMILAISLTALPACKRRVESVKDDLGKAGYTLSPEDWFRASRDNDVTALKKFVSTGFVVGRTDGEGNTALHAAAGAGAMAAAEYLLDRKLEVDVRGASQRTPMMTAVLGDQTEMTGWLLRQGADAQLKDAEGFSPLMLAVREGKAGSVAELAPYDRGSLDAALLLAALLGRADVIDSLTNFGASVYARREDGRTPLMVAAENGHEEAVRLLLDIGASRFAMAPDGRTAADLAIAAGHPGLAELISKEPDAAEMALESPAEVADEMVALVDAAVRKSQAGNPAVGERASGRRGPSISIGDQTLSAPVAPERGIGDDSFAMPPLVMRAYREKEMPLNLRTVRGDTAVLGISGPVRREVSLKAGDAIPGTRLVVVRVRKRMEDSKVNLGQPSEISVVEVRDSSTGVTREWISGVPSTGHDPVALVEDAATGRRYLAAAGQRFKGADGTDYRIAEVRPNQLVIQQVTGGAVRTIPLRGPRG